MPQQQEEIIKQETLEAFLFPEQQPIEDDVDINRISFDPSLPESTETISAY